jgi:hypothetical protein
VASDTLPKGTAETEGNGSPFRGSRDYMEGSSNCRLILDKSPLSISDVQKERSYGVGLMLFRLLENVARCLSCYYKKTTDSVCKSTPVR